ETGHVHVLRSSDVVEVDVVEAKSLSNPRVAGHRIFVGEGHHHADASAAGRRLNDLRGFYSTIAQGAQQKITRLVRAEFAHETDFHAETSQIAGKDRRRTSQRKPHVFGQPHFTVCRQRGEPG